MGLNAYNKLTNYRLLSYYIISYLMDNNEIIWKLLKYPNNDALDMPNLTLTEKAELIYNGEINAEPFRVFRTAFPMDDAYTEQITQLRIFPTYNNPENRMASVQDFMINPITHVKLSHLNDYSTRIDTMVEEVIRTLNGVLVEGVGVMYFDAGRQRSNSIKYTPNIGNNKNFEGAYIIMSCNLVAVE